MPGNPKIGVEGLISLSGFRKVYVDGEWLVSRVLSKSESYRTTVEAVKNVSL